MRTILCLAALALVPSAHAGTIKVGGDFHLGEFPILVLDAGIGFEWTKWFLPQPAAGDMHELAFDLDQLAYIATVNNAFDEPHALLLVGSDYFVDSPLPYAGAMTLELIGGPLVGPPERPTGQQWTYIVDGGTPEVRTVYFIPEPAAWLLAVLPAMMIRRRH